MKHKRILFVSLLILVFCNFSRVLASGQALFNEQLLKNFTYRNLGPFRVGSMIMDFAVPESPPKAQLYTFYVGTRNGGVWKTENNGTTFEPVFDGQSRLTIGDIAVAPLNPDVVWVGTGETLNARSSNSGAGVYKSTDGGKTWKNMGLRDSQHISRILVDPRNSDIVYVAAMGHLFSANEERGVFKTSNGGETWDKVLYINEKVGIIDLVMNPSHPEILYAAAFEKTRLPWLFDRAGPGSGIYKTSDAGKTWTKLDGGLPGGRIGRIGIDIYLKNSNILYAIVDNANKRPPTKKEAEQDQSRGLKPQDRDIGGEVYRTDDGGKTWKKTNPNEVSVLSKGGGQLRVDPNDERKIFVTGVALTNSTDGGKTWNDLEWPPKRLFSKMFGDVRTLWIDPQNSDRILLGSDGGVFISYDGGKTCDHFYNLPLGEFYAIGVDMEDPYNIYGGLQDHEMWKIPSNSASGEVRHFDWVAVGGGDGMFTQVDPTDSRWLYTTREQGSHSRVDQKLGYRVSIVPQRESGAPPYRFVWCAPIHISPHNSQIIYAGAQVLLRSLDRGDHWQQISPDLSTNDTSKMVPTAEGGIPWFAITTISESPVIPGIIWVGTSDGKVQATRNGGTTWTDLTKSVANAGGPEDYYVSRVFASHFKEGTAYVTKSGFRHDDFRPFVFKTENYGATWTSISANLPDRAVNVIFEDRENPDLLFVGNDSGVYVSINGGKNWTRMNNNIPNVPVHDLLVHPRENDLVVGTYGRGLFVTDIAPLEEMTEKTLAEDVHLFDIEPKPERIIREFGAEDYLFGDRHLLTPNEPNGIVIHYYLKNTMAEKAKVTIADAIGTQFAKLEGPAEAGMNQVIWNMRRPMPKRDEFGARMQRARNPLAQWAPLGEYTISLEIGGQKLSKRAQITKRIGWSIGPMTETIRDESEK
jgi:photosystem II stability/assembly factor-like uncharacterized protein